MSIFDNDEHSKLPDFLRRPKKPEAPTMERDGYEFLSDTKKDPEPEVSIPEITNEMLEQAKAQLDRAISDPTINADAALAQFEHLERLQSRQAAQRMEAAIDKATQDALNAEISRKKTGLAHPGQGKPYSHYQNLRRTDPKTYYSPRIQNQMAQDAANLGSKFYDH